MELRRRSAASSAKKAKKCAPPTPTASRNQDLLPEILHLISNRLSSEDIAQASSSCKSWAHHLRAGIKQVQLVVCQPPDDKLVRSPATESLSKHSPALTELQLLLSGRSSYDPVAKVVSKLSCLQSLQRVTIDFMVSQTARKGGWPMFFADSLQLGKLPALTIKGPHMPPMAITNLLERLSTSKRHLKQLHLLLGQHNPCSQLPRYRPPQWLQPADHLTAYVSTLNDKQVDMLSRLTGLQDLAFEPDFYFSSNSIRQLSKLKALTSLQVLGMQPPQMLGLIPGLKKLCRLGVDTMTWPNGESHLRDSCTQLQFIEEVNLGLLALCGQPKASHLHQVVQVLASTLSSNLRGLTLNEFAWSTDTGDCLAVLTALTSLQLLKMNYDAPEASDCMLVDLTPLGKMRGMKRFIAGFPDSPQLLVRFGVFWEVEQQRRSSTGRRSSRRLSQQQQQQKAPHLKAPDPCLTGLKMVWPELQQLQLTGLRDACDAAGIWHLRQLTCLTSLSLQFAATAVPAVMTLQDMPGQLKAMQLANCRVMVTKCCPFKDHLTSLSVSNCNIKYHQTLSDAQDISSLLQQLTSLQHLELINLPQVDDKMLGDAVGALTSLQSLSVAGIGNQQLTHAGLLGLTGLKKLRQLRWHVGDVLDMLPDLTSLAKLKGLVALHIHTALHTQMQRWGAYAVLDSLPYCDVHVEAV